MPLLGERIILRKYVLLSEVLFLLPRDCDSLLLEPFPY